MSLRSAILSFAKHGLTSGCHALARFRLRRRVSVHLLLLLAISTAFVARADGVASDFIVIVHPANATRSLDRRALSKIFLKEISRWENGEQLYPVDLPRNSSTRSRFSSNVLGRSVAAVHSYWQQRIFSGRGVPPPEVSSDAEVVQYVLKRAGAVGYVTSGTDIGKAKAISISGD
jgi:ABC-type phosphate transport system substrate-binding protein